MLNILSKESPISDKKVSASSVAQLIITTLIQSKLDGVSIEFDDYKAVS